MVCFGTCHMFSVKEPELWTNTGFPPHNHAVYFCPVVMIQQIFFQTGESEKYDFRFLFPILWLIGLPVFMTTCFIMGTLPLKLSFVVEVFFLNKHPLLTAWRFLQNCWNATCLN